MKKLADGETQLSGIFKHKYLPDFVIKEGTSNGVSIIDDNGNWRLLGNGVQFMQLITKSNREIKQLYSSFDLAYGDVFITGLGFGILALWVANKPEVKSVTVIENSQGIIDLFLASNKMPENVTIILGDADTYTTDKHYDCLLIDHYNTASTKEFTYKRTKNVADNIPHDLFWFWSIEQRYAIRLNDLTMDDLILKPIDLSKIDFKRKWKTWIDVLEIPTVPLFASEKIGEYIDYYTNRR